MASEPNDTSRLRVVTLDDAQRVLAARQRAEEDLRQQSEWLRITLASIGDAVITTDAEGRVSFMNAVAEALTGWPQADALGQLVQDVFKIVDESSRQPLANPASEALRAGKVIRLPSHTVLIARDGSEHPIDDSAAPIRDSSGAAIGVVLVFRDVQERKSTELARAHLAAIVESSEDAIVSKTLQGIILSWNKGAERLFGYPASEAIGQPITMLIPTERLAEEREILARVIAGDRVEHFETVRVTKQGRRIDISLTVSPIRDASNRIVGASKVARDMTAQVLARRQLNELREAAEAANRAKDEFLAMLGHELRNPLSPILTALQLMRLRGSDASEREGTVIERQVRHLTRLVDDLLDVSRIARGQVELEEEIVEIAEVVAKGIEIASPLLEQRTHTLDVNVPRKGLQVRGDAIRLSQVVSNLATNAAKYTSPGGHITIRAAEENGEVVIRVRDNGIGIAPEVLPRVFDLFVQGSQAIDRSQGGLGLGLTIVRNLVERHGGSVSAHSDGPGRGSEFVVRLPKATVAASPESSAMRPDPARAVSSHADSLRILVVDDSVDGAEMLAAALAANGYATRVAHDAPAALRVAAEFLPAVAFLDIGLPVMDGYELAVHLRQVPGLADIRLVALTGYGQESDRERAQNAGFQHHLVKPVALQAIVAVLARISDELGTADQGLSAPGGT